MPLRSARCRAWLLPALVAVLLGGRLSADDAPTVTGTGVIEGVIRYDADPVRAWRYARYYVKDRHKGELAEAVVALARPRVAGETHSPATAVVDQKDFQFTPETSAIRAGDSVRFLNGDAQLHNVRSAGLRDTFNVTIPPDGEYVQEFTQAGGIRRPHRVGCVYHSAMRAWVFVFDHPSFQVTGTDGRFRLENVPPGEYTLEVVHPAGELQSRRKVVVRAGETLPLDWRLSPDDKTPTVR